MRKEAYVKLYADGFTCGLRQMLLDEPMNDWKIVDGSNCLHLIDSQTRLKIRFLKSFAFTGGLPPAGHNKARIDAWCQLPLDSYSQERLFAPRPLEGTELVLTWTERDGSFECTVYQPLSPGRYPKGAPAKAIMSLPIGIDADDYEHISFGVDASDEYE